MGFDFDPGAELSLLTQTAREFAKRKLAPAARTAEQARGVSQAVWSAFDAIGLAGLELPEALGGAGLGSVARALVNEELGAGDPGAALALDPLGPALYALDELGGEAAVRELGLPLVSRPGARAVLAIAGAGLELSGDTATAELPFVPADRVDLLVLLATDAAVVISKGIELRPLPGAGLQAAGASSLTLQSAPVLARYEGQAAAGRALARARLHVASLLLGVLRQACQYAQTYAQERVAFGKPIAHHQALAFMLTDMHTAVELCRLLIHEAAWLIERGAGASTHVEAKIASASALVETIEASRFIGPAGVQVLGGHGFMRDHPVEKYNREARVLSLLLGGIDAAREDAGQALQLAPLPLSLTAEQD